MYLFLVALSRAGESLFGYISLYWLLAGLSARWGNLPLSYNPLPQNPRSTGTSPLELSSLNRKNLPIEVTLGGIGSITPICLFTSIFYPNYKLRDNILALLSRNTKSNLPQMTLFQ
jgi:hypothetical protein